MDVQKLWDDFKNKNNIDNDYYSIWAFGDNSDLLLELVMLGEKNCNIVIIYVV